MCKEPSVFVDSESSSKQTQLKYDAVNIQKSELVDRIWQEFCSVVIGF